MNLAAKSAGHAGEEQTARLTARIHQAFTALEAKRPNCFFYGDVNLRGTIERQIYLEALADGRGLEALRRGLISVRSAGCDPGLLAWQAAGRISTLKNLSHSAKAYVRLALGVARCCQPEPGLDRRRNSSPRYVFCAIDKRFVSFFAPVIERLGAKDCALLCLGTRDIEDEAAKAGIAVLPSRPARVQLRRLHAPPSSLLPLYVTAVTLFASAYASVAAARPHALIFGEGASAQEDAAARAARSLGIPTVRLQHGRAGMMHPGYYDMQYDKMLMWGEGFSERLRPFSPSARFIVTGSPLLDEDASAGSIDTRLDKFCGTDFVVTVITQPISVNVWPGDYEALAQTAEEILARLPDAKVLVRLHPRDKGRRFVELSAHFPNRVLVSAAAEYPLRSVFKRATIVVGLFSTALSEAAAFGVIPIVLSLGPRHQIYPAPEQEGAAVLVTSPSAAVDAAARLLTQPAERLRYAENMRKFSERYFGPRDGAALSRIVDHISNPAA